MTLQEYFQWVKSHNATSLARRIGVNKENIYQWQVGIRQVPIRYAHAVEVFTDGKVTRKDMYPDTWREIWPELDEGK